jgi:hypothetical protein
MSPNAVYHESALGDGICDVILGVGLNFIDFRLGQFAVSSPSVH